MLFPDASSKRSLAVLRLSPSKMHGWLSQAKAFALRAFDPLGFAGSNPVPCAFPSYILS